MSMPTSSTLPIPCQFYMMTCLPIFVPIAIDHMGNQHQCKCVIRFSSHVCAQVAVALGAAVYLWNAGTGNIEELCSTTEEDNYITSLSWAADGAPLHRYS